MILNVIELELARNPGHPAGDPSHGYVLRAPLNAEGYVDRARWPETKGLCTVKRIESGREVESGLLILTRGGKWVFSYAPGTEDDETLFRLGDHRFAPGEYISITEHDGVQRTFKVASLRIWHPNPGAAGSTAKR